MKTMKRLLGLLCCLVLLASVLPVLADAEFTTVRFMYSKKERVVDLSEQFNLPEGGLYTYAAKIKSSSPKSSCTVDSNGMITVEPYYLGIINVKFTVYEIVGSKKVEYDSGNFALTFYPPRTSFSSVTSTKAGKAKLVWKESAGADAYIIHYSTNKNMKDADSVIIEKTYATINRLKVATTYYFTVTPILYVNNTIVYGKVSALASTKIYPQVLVDHFHLKLNGKLVENTTVKLKLGKTTTLSVAGLRPTNATIKTITWESLDTSIATVNAKGRITPVKTGEVYIIATAADGSGACCAVLLKVVK